MHRYLAAKRLGGGGGAAITGGDEDDGHKEHGEATESCMLTAATGGGSATGPPAVVTGLFTEAEVARVLAAGTAAKWPNLVSSHRPTRLGHGALVFEQDFALEDAIGIHVAGVEAQPCL
jgi:hypothetical protein